MKVIELVMAQRAHGWSPEELSFQFPRLSMGQIHAALAFYWDNQEALETDIDERNAAVSELQTHAEPSPLASRLTEIKRQR